MFLLQTLTLGAEKSVEKILSVSSKYHNGGRHLELEDRTPDMCVAWERDTCTENTAFLAQLALENLHLYIYKYPYY